MSKFTSPFTCPYMSYLKNVNIFGLPFILSASPGLRDLCSHWWCSGFLLFLLTDMFSSSKNTDFPLNNIAHSTIFLSFSDSTCCTEQDGFQSLLSKKDSVLKKVFENRIEKCFNINLPVNICLFYLYQLHLTICKDGLSFLSILHWVEDGSDFLICGVLLKWLS